MMIYLMVGSKEKMKKKCPSAQLGSPDYIHECSRANVLTLQHLHLTIARCHQKALKLSYYHDDIE